MTSLPVSIIASDSIGGVPKEYFIRYSPFSGINLGEISLLRDGDVGD